MSGKGWLPLSGPKNAGEVGPWPASPVLFWPVTYGTLRVLMGMGELMNDERAWKGAAAAIAQALETLDQQLSEPPLTLAEVCGMCDGGYGALFQLVGADLQEQQGAGLPPPPWEFRIVAGTDGTYTWEYRHHEQ